MAEKYSVFVDDNYHAYDEDERYLKGEYGTLEEAIAVSKKIVDAFLENLYRPGMTAKELLDGYRGYGEDPFIMPGEGGVPFSAWGYAAARCHEICRD